jgi:hypothetical protein
VSNPDHYGWPVILRLRGVRLLPALFVVFGTLLAAAPAQAADDDFAFRGTYLRTADNGCDAGDVPTFGGHYSSSGNPLLRWHPAMIGDRGTWEAAADTTLHKSVVCLDFAAAVPFRIMQASWTPGTDNGASASCALGEYAVAGGFYFPSGLQGKTTANRPDGDRAWGVEGGGDPRASNTAYAVCAKLPAGFTTYSTSAQREDAGEVTASCRAGDVPVTGGWDAANVRASYPEPNGWTVVTGAGGGYSSAFCLSGLKDRVGTRVAKGTHPYLNAECASDEFLLNAGWDTGAGMADLRVFLPWNSTSRGWTIASNEGNSSSSLAIVLCGKVLAPPAPTWSAERLPWAGAIGLVGLVGLGALIVGGGRLTTPIRAAVGAGTVVAVIGAVGVALIPIDAGAVTPPGDSDTVALPAGTPTSSPSATASVTASASASASESASASPTESVSASASASATSATAKPSVKPTPKKSTSSAAPAPAPVVDFRVSPTSWSQLCDGASLKPVEITVDNSRSNRSANWSGNVTPKDGQSWASLSPSNGTVPAGATRTFQIVPNSNACEWVFKQQQVNGYKTGTFTVQISYPGGSSTITGTVRIKALY